jgi:hypothetical protein
MIQTTHRVLVNLTTLLSLFFLVPAVDRAHAQTGIPKNNPVRPVTPPKKPAPIPEPAPAPAPIVKPILVPAPVPAPAVTTTIIRPTPSSPPPTTTTPVVVVQPSINSAYLGAWSMTGWNPTLYGNLNGYGPFGPYSNYGYWNSFNNPFAMANGFNNPFAIPTTGFSPFPMMPFNALNNPLTPVGWNPWNNGNGWAPLGPNLNLPRFGLIGGNGF